MRATFSPAARLHRPSEYAHAMQGRRIARGALFVLRRGAPPADPSDPSSGPRLGLIIAKRYAPLAVTRNAIKRVLREAFRQRRHTLAPGDYVFRLHAPVGSTSLSALKKRVRHEADQLLDKGTP